MQLVTGALGSLIPKLGELLKEEYKLQKGMKEQIKSLALELETTSRSRSGLASSGRRPMTWRTQSTPSWSAYKAASRPAQTGSSGSWRRLAACSAGSRLAIRSLARSVPSRSRSTTWPSVVAGTTSMMLCLGLPHHHRRLILASQLCTRVTELIGIDKSRSELISLISSKTSDDANRKVKMVSVIGVGGLGKTTLAKASYDMLKADFDCGAFVPVGRNPDLKKVLKDILFDLDKGRFMNMTMDIMMIILDDERRLINEVRKFLQNKRYFFVIDDVWEIQSWETIKLAFIENNLESRVVITTRKLEVAMEVGEVYYKLQPLSYDNSRKLFYTRIFGGQGKYLDNQPDDASDKFLKKCDGVPLAIITMANLLVGKPREQWSDMYCSVGFGNKDNRHVENTMRILSFSYYDLPSHLRTCLLHISAFPEDYVIDKDSLIWKWIAEGFVHNKQGKRLERDTSTILIINRSMIQAVESESDGFTVEGCRVHDMVLELTRSISREENFFTIIDNDRSTLSQSTVRRLAYHNNILFTHWVGLTDMPHLRSIISCQCNFHKWVPFSSFKLLRVLAIEDFGYAEGFHFENIGKLLHLRYLGLKQLGYWSDKNAGVLSEAIRALKFLQTLELSGGFQNLPWNFYLVTQLVCLRVKIETLNWLSGKLTSLTSLEELTIYSFAHFGPSRQFFRELGCMKELRVLRITFPIELDKDVARNFMASLCNLHNIQHLNVCGSQSFILPRHLRHLGLEEIWLSRLPSYRMTPTYLPYLSYLCLNLNLMDETDLKVLSGLPELSYLRLRTLSTVSLNIPANDGFFQKLRFCMMMYSMVQFINNEDSSVSFHMWNGVEGDIPFGSRKKNEQCRVVPNVMPNVELLDFAVPVRALKDGNGTCDNLGLEHLASLRKVRATTNCRGACTAEVEEVEASLRHAVETGDDNKV
ncbi:hypothetical protein EJB05_15131, partial [Eragrostis curvula]